MSTTTKTRTTTLALAALVAVGALAGCSGATERAATSPAATTAPVTVETTAPTEPTPEGTPTVAAPVAGPYDELLADGTVHAGTEKAPSRIGTDTPGAAPAAEAGYATAADRHAYAEQSGKYSIVVFSSPGDGWAWKVFGTDRWGSYREISDSGYSYRQWLPSKDAALAGPFTVDGRALDRAEYLLYVWE